MFNIGCGCFSLFIGILAALLLIKFWLAAFLFLILIFLIYKDSTKNPFSKAGFNKKKKVTIKPGMVYKECSFCNTKTVRTATCCDNCGKPFDRVII